MIRLPLWAGPGNGATATRQKQSVDGYT